MSEQLKFEVGKHYKTRNGRKATVLLIQAKYMVGEIEGSDRNPYIWNRGGGWHAEPIPYPCDLVAEWREPRRWNVLIWQTLDGKCSTVSFENVEYEGAEWQLVAKAELVEGQGME